MIIQIADFDVLADKQEQFAAAIHEVLPLAAETPGFLRAHLTRSLETTTRFVLMIEWDSVEAHTVSFHESENYARWRKIVGPFFAGPPLVEHFDQLVTHPHRPRPAPDTQGGSR